jgi:hypothetical protein
MTRNFVKGLIRDNLDKLADFTAEALRSAAVDDIETARILEAAGKKVVEDLDKLVEIHREEEDGE